jgi:acetate kinase
MPILIINGGSTGVKLALLGDGPARRWSPPPSSPADLVARLEVDWETIAAVGHRVVHGGERFVAPCRITGAVLDDLRGLAPFDPKHLPLQIALIAEVARRHPALPQVACFDTAFHATLPAVARLLPLPRRLYQRGVRRYGFHGLSYQWSMRELERRHGREAARGRIVIAHLGGGASLAAVRDGRCLDTTMGFTPTGGIPMGTRSGDLDPGVLAYLAQHDGMSAEEIARLTNEESGLLGLSEISGDLRTLAASSDPRAAEAISLFCYEAKKRIGAFAAALGGLDRLVFTGGIGEHAADVRARICAELDFLGISLDPERNGAHAPVISRAQAPVTVEVIAADEEAMVAEGVRAVLATNEEP